jgi:hypothetical protein
MKRSVANKRPRYRTVWAPPTPWYRAFIMLGLAAGRRHVALGARAALKPGAAVFENLKLHCLGGAYSSCHRHQSSSSSSSPMRPLPPFPHTPAPYTGPSADEVLALRRKHMSAGNFHFYKQGCLAR